MYTPTIAVSKTSSALPARRRFGFWQAALFYVSITVIGRLVSGSPKANRAFYKRKEKQAPWAPPGWAFGLAWPVINVFVTRALQQLANEPNKDKRTRQLLALQGLLWAVYGTFGYVYFRKRSPVLAAVFTQTDAVAATASFLIARKKDKAFANNYLPLLGWTWYASTLAWYQAAKNGDPLLDTPAPL